MPPGLTFQTHKHGVLGSCVKMVEENKDKRNAKQIAPLSLVP